MPVIDIRRPYSGSVTSAKAAVDQIALAIAGQYGVSHQWIGDELHFDRGGIKGRIAIARHEVHVHVELGMLMGTMKPLIEREIGRRLDEYIA